MFSNILASQHASALLWPSLLQYVHVQKELRAIVLFAFSLPNLLCSTYKVHSSLIPPHGSARIALASLLFDPAEPKTRQKHHLSRLLYLFADLDLLCADSFSSLMHLSILSEVWLLNFFPSPMATSSMKFIITQPDSWILPVTNSLAQLGFPVITDAPHSWCILPISQHRKTWRQLEGAAAWTSVFLSHGCVHLWLVDGYDGNRTTKSISICMYI